MSLLLSSRRTTAPTAAQEARPFQKKKNWWSPLMEIRLVKKGAHSLHRGPRRASSSSSRKSHRHAVPIKMDPTLRWMKGPTCPGDIVPKILSFCGPQMVALLSQTCRYWRDVCLSEQTWRILCEELYKWKEGDAIPSSWRELYQNSPCVPIDYRTLPAALAVAEDSSNPSNPPYEQQRSIRILLRPGDYVLRESVIIQAVPNTQVTIETMTGFPFEANHQVADEFERTPPKATRRFAQKAASLRNRLSCRSSAENDVVMEVDEPPQDTNRLMSNDRAALVLRTRRHNEPIFRVRQGTVKMSNIELLHNSHGIDIWNGNAAIQIQPPNTLQGQEQPPPPIPEALRPMCFVDNCEIISHSGRGIVNIDGGLSVIQNCYIHNCAATGIYVGGPGSQAVIESTDVMHNGNGNVLSPRRGIARGHSGVYLEQGKAIIRNCNISRNSLTGISAVSQANALLELQASDLVANGAAQLEIPRGVSSAYWTTRNNNRLASIGYTRSRSGLVEEEEEEMPPEEALL